MTEAAISSNTQFYHWRSYRCAYELHTPTTTASDSVPLLLIHPIGVGLSRRFWHRFCREWYKAGHSNPIYNPDLLGCGESALPHIAYTPTDWALQLQHFLQTVVQKPVIVVVQGALLSVALKLAQLQTEQNLFSQLVLASPPAWAVITESTPVWRQKLTWNTLDSLLGTAFYRYARRVQFLRSFSTRQLFDNPEQVDAEWLDMLVQGAENPASRYAVFSFLSGFWRQNYEQEISAITQPTLVVVGDTASSISRMGNDTPEQRLTDYLQCLSQGEGRKIAGRNVLPYESTTQFIAATAPFIDKFS